MARIFCSGCIHALAVISPGPDFVMIVRQALLYTRRVGVYSAIGLGLGILVHVVYSLLGVGLLISQSILLFSIMKFAAAGYLVWIGIQGLRSRKSAEKEVLENEAAISEVNVPTAFSAIKTGFLTNVFNPKVSLFFLSVFTLVISSTTPLWAQMIYGLEMALATMIWFTIVALVLSQKKIQKKFMSIRHVFDKVTGGALVALGIKIALTKK